MAPIRLLPASRPAALIALGIALAAEVAWLVHQLFIVQTPVSGLSRSMIFTGAFIAVLATRGMNPWINSVARFVVAGAFLSALWNRFDDFSGFVRYTGVVNSFMPERTIPVLAVLATVAEIAFCVLLFIGFRISLASFGSAVLLFLFATAMTISGQEQFSWAVYVLSMGAWALSTVDASVISLDRLIASK